MLQRAVKHSIQSNFRSTNQYDSPQTVIFKANQCLVCQPISIGRVSGFLLRIITLKQPIMSEHFEAQGQQSVTESEPNLSQLKKEVQITPSILKEITLKEQFLDRVIELSSNAKQSINIDRAKEALVYLNQGEKILEYAASCGKTIDKNMIISVLHNIACCYQKIWELDKCSQYLEALIFNFNSFIKTERADEEPKDKNRADDSIIAQGLDRRTFLARYYLQFCAVNSQTENHSGALVAARKSIQIMRGVFGELYEVSLSMKKMTYEKKSEFEYKLRVIELCARVSDALNVSHYDTVLKAAKHYLRQWRALRDNKERADRNYVLQEEFKNYSIGNAMQINPITYREFEERHGRSYSSKVILEKVLLMALGYFTISTELRLIATKKGNRQGQKTPSAQLRESEIYHLLSIIIAATCVPFDILYMKHVLSSYSNHYGTDLTDDTDPKLKEGEIKAKQTKFEELVFPQQLQLRKATTNNSLTNSLDHQETVSKFQKDQADYLTSNEAIERRKLEDSKEDQTIKNDSKKSKPTTTTATGKPKSKSKSKHMKSLTFLGSEERSEKASPMPKSPNAHLRSPNAHLKSPVPKNNLIKVKTSYKVKVSTEKIVTTTNQPGKEEKSRKKREVRAQNIEFDYFMGRSKDLKKAKKTLEQGYNLASPRHNNSKSSSKRESPIPKYFEQLKPQSPLMKNLKSPRKNTTNTKSKNNFQQYYL